MKKIIFGTAVIFALSTLGVTYAQTTPNQGTNNNYSDGYGWCGGGMGYGHGGGRRGHGGGMGYGHGYMMQDNNGTPLMTQNEWMNNRDRIYSSKSFSECKTVQTDFQNTMSKRAKAQGISMPNTQNQGMCERLNDRGYFKK